MLHLGISGVLFLDKTIVIFEINTLESVSFQNFAKKPNNNNNNKTA